MCFPNFHQLSTQHFFNFHPKTATTAPDAVGFGHPSGALGSGRQQGAAQLALLCGRGAGIREEIGHHRSLGSAKAVGKPKLKRNKMVENVNKNNLEGFLWFMRT